MTNELTTIFETKIWNRRRELVRLHDSNGQMVCAVQPDAIEIIESKNDKTIYAPYADVILEADGRVTTSIRPGWVPPNFKELSEVIIENLDGQELEARVIGGRTIHIPNGFAVHVWVDSADPNAKYERIVIKRVRERVKSPVFPGYWIWRETVKDVPSYRPENEVNKNAKDLKAPKVAT